MVSVVQRSKTNYEGKIERKMESPQLPNGNFELHLNCENQKTFYSPNLLSVWFEPPDPSKMNLFHHCVILWSFSINANSIDSRAKGIQIKMKTTILWIGQTSSEITYMWVLLLCSIQQRSFITCCTFHEDISVSETTRQILQAYSSN